VLLVGFFLAFRSLSAGGKRMGDALGRVRESGMS
jgi:hypothetical protein